MKISKRDRALDAIVEALAKFQRGCENGSLPRKNPYDAAIMVICELEEAGLRLVSKPAAKGEQR